MIDLAKLRVVIDGENRGALRALDETDKKVSSVGGRISGAMGLAARAVLTSTTAAVGAIGGFGLKIAASNEQASIAFTTLLGDASKAQAYMKELSDFAAKTPFELPGLRDAAARLIAVGTESSRVIPVMAALGDATSAMGTGSEGISRAVTALTQMQQKGKATGEEMLQLAEAGVPAWDALAASLGKSVAETQKLVSQGGVSADQVLKAVEDRSGAAMQRVTGMMEKQSQSLTGLLSTLKDTVSQQLGAAMQPAVEEIKKQMPGITEAIGGALAKLGPVIGPVVASLGQALQALLPAITPVLDVISQLLATGLGALAQIVADVVAPALTNLQPVFAALTESFGILANALGPAIKPVLDGLVTAFNALAPALPPLAVLIGKLAGAIGAALGRVLEKIAPQIPDLTEQFIRLAEEALPPLVDAVVALAPVLAIVAELLAGGLVVAMRVVVPVVRVLADALRGFALLLEAVFSAKWDDIFDGAADKVNEWIDGVLSFFGSLPSKLAAIAGNIWKPIANAFIEMLNMIIGAWNSLDFKLPSFGGLSVAGKQVLPGWEGPTLGVPDIPEIPKFHAGGVSTTEGLALLRRDETVFTPDQMRVLGQAIAAGGTGATPIAVTSAPVLRIEGNVYAGDLEERLNRILKQHDRDLLDELTARGFVSRR